MAMVNTAPHDSNLSIDLARALRESGLVWEPRNGDLFHIPDRGFDGQLFSVSEMAVNVRTVRGQPELAFNGTVEWALDSIRTTEVVWVPTERQLRSALGRAFIALYADEGDTFACVARIGEIPTTFVGTSASDAYGRALLALLAPER